MLPAGVVFDFDGVLVDSMRQHEEAYRRVLAPLGFDVPIGSVLAREGARSRTIIRELIEAAGAEPTGLDIPALSAQKQDVFQAIGMPAIYPGAAPVLEGLWENNILTAVVTGTHRQNLDALKPDWIDRFDAIVAQEDYTHDKPHPEPYATAAGRLGIAPERLVAVENATRGIDSARAAGYGRIIGITTTMPPEALAGADDIVPDHATLGPLLRHILRGEA